MNLKVCGITPLTDVEKLIGSVSYLGFIFYEPSPRNAYGMSPEKIRALKKDFETVAVSVNLPLNELISLCRERDITTVQLHGEESPDYANRLKDVGFTILKAFRISHLTTPEVLEKMTRGYKGIADLLVFDAAGKAPGGNGTKFDHEILKSYSGAIPYLLSGGIGPDDLEHFINLDTDQYPGFFGLDLNSRFEISPGKKDCNKIIEFVKKLKSSGTQTSKSL